MGQQGKASSARSKRKMTVSMVSKKEDAELVSGRFVGLERLKFEHQNGKKTVV